MHRNFGVADSGFCVMILSNGREIFQRREKESEAARDGEETHFGQPKTGIGDETHFGQPETC